MQAKQRERKQTKQKIRRKKKQKKHTNCFIM